MVRWQVVSVGSVVRYVEYRVWIEVRFVREDYIIFYILDKGLKL